MNRSPKLFRPASFGVVLALIILAIPAVSQALDIILPIHLPRFALPLPSVSLNENVIRIPMTVSPAASNVLPWRQPYIDRLVPAHSRWWS